MKTVIYTLVFLGSILLSACIDEIKVPENTYKENFESLWRMIDTKYCYLDYKQINWDSVHEVYESRLNTDTLDKYVFFEAMSQMLANLKDGHVNIYSGFNTSRFYNWYADYPSNFNKELIYKDRYLGKDYGYVNGIAYSKIADGRVGYVYYGSFANDFSTNNMKEVLLSFSSCDGVIIDVRNNGGGSLNLSNDLASWFFERDTVSLYMKEKTGPGHNDFSSPKPMKTTASSSLYWAKPVIVLTNRMCYSATNSFVARMKDAPNCVVIGDKTGGGGGLPLSDELPNGWLVRFSSAQMLDGAMEQIEFGVNPDIAVSLDSTSMANGIDNIIETAVLLIHR